MCDMIDSICRNANEAFFSSLPTKGLSDEETKLLELLQDVAAVVESFLPPGVSLQQWAAIRVPKSDVERVNASRMVFVPKRTPLIRKAPVADIATAPRGVETAVADAEGPSADDFLDALPEDLLPWEENLRNCMRLALKSRGRRPLTEVANHPKAKIVLEKELPPTVPFEDWITRRAGGNFMLELNADNVLELYKGALNEEEREAYAENKAAKADAFFANLPQDAFSAEETDLRNAIIWMLESRLQQRRSSPVTLEELSKDEVVKDARFAFLPREVPMRLWCTNRMGEEVEFTDIPNTSITAVGFIGQWDPEGAELQELAARRRRRTAY
eukprot:TRINITY_DN4370_c0_g4_i1.p1 TRINITY_DN4370_c0_g4~~TRINITY_DN4370_c0_g4_i1.p1  ORF type:complete len:329 (-),score=50.54 TRINITY_DN4370_c0_g4_i1:102-1088(-)